MKTLKEPKYRDLQLSECAGAPILRTLWERFDISFLLTQSGIMKRSGTPSWLLCFLYVVGLISNCSSFVQMADMAQKDSLLKVMLGPWKLAQYTMSRFFTTSLAWKTFGKKRVERLHPIERSISLLEPGNRGIVRNELDFPFGNKSKGQWRFLQ